MQRLDLKDAIFSAATHLLPLSVTGSLLGQGMDIVLQNMWWQLESEMDDKLYNMYKRTTRKLNKANNIATAAEKSKIMGYLGNIHYHCFLAQLKVARKKQKEEVETSQKFAPVIVNQAVERGEADGDKGHAVCDITPTYENLNLTKEGEVLQMLKQAIDCWTACCDAVFTCSPDIVELINNILPNIETSAYIYNLYGSEIHSIDTWMLYYKLASLISDENGILLALCYLLEYSNDLEHEYWRKAATLALNLQMKDTNKELVYKYWLSRSHCCLKNAEYDEGLQLLLKITPVRKNLSPIMEMCFIRAHLLLSKYMCVPGMMQKAKCLKEMNALYCVGYAIYAVQKLPSSGNTASPNENTQANCLLMDVTEWIGELYLRQKLPRDVRSYLKLQLIYAQMMALAVRTAQLLSKLAQVDLLCWQVPECQVKLIGMCSILELNETLFPLFENKDTKAYVKGDDIISLDELDLSRGTRRLATLDIPENRSPMASPELRKTYFKLPPMLKHSEGCKCSLCNSISYQNLLLELTMIQAQLHVLEKSYEHALSFYNGGIHLAQLLQKSQIEILNNLLYNLDSRTKFPSIICRQNAFIVSISKFLSQYADFLAQCFKYSEARTFNEAATCALNEMRELHPHIASDLLEQKISLLQAPIEEALIKQALATKIELPVSSAGVEQFTDIRTPVVSAPAKSLLTRKDIIIQEPIPTPKRIPSSLVANLFGDDMPSGDCRSTKPRKFFKTPCRLTPSVCASSARKTKKSAKKDVDSSTSSSDLPDIVIKSPASRKAIRTIKKPERMPSLNDTDSDSSVFVSPVKKYNTNPAKKRITRVYSSKSSSSSAKETSTDKVEITSDTFLLPKKISRSVTVTPVLNSTRKKTSKQNATPTESLEKALEMLSISNSFIDNPPISRIDPPVLLKSKRNEKRNTRKGLSRNDKLCEGFDILNDSDNPVECEVPLESLIDEKKNGSAKEIKKKNVTSSKKNQMNRRNVDNIPLVNENPIKTEDKPVSKSRRNPTKSTNQTNKTSTRGRRDIRSTDPAS